MSQSVEKTFLRSVAATFALPDYSHGELRIPHPAPVINRRRAGNTGNRLPGHSAIGDRGAWRQAV